MTSSTAPPTTPGRRRAASRCKRRDDTFVYVSATRGFKSGGFNITAQEPGEGLQPEFAWSYEGGLKRTMAGGRVRVNTAVFYNDYRTCRCSRFSVPA